MFTHVAPFDVVKIDKEGGYSLRDVIDWIEVTRPGKLCMLNGLDQVGGWEILTEVRNRLMGDEKTSPEFVVVKNASFVGRVASIGKLEMHDLVRQRERMSQIPFKYWYEFAGERSLSSIVARIGVEAFIMELFLVGDDFRVVKCIVPCAPEDYDCLVKNLGDSDLVNVTGMHVQSSGHQTKREDWMIVVDLHSIDEQFDKIDGLLAKLTDWTQLTPMRHAKTQEPLFPEIQNLAIICSVLFTRMSVPAFNTVFFGPSGHGKTAVIRYLVEDLMGGSFESATASSGKGWLLSFKEGVAPSKLFVERRCILIDEMLKAVSTGVSGGYRKESYAVELKNFLQKHMQILYKEQVDASSGVGVLKGRMVCSFVGTENDDETLMHALGRAEILSPAALRRIQIGYIERDSHIDDFFSSVSTKGACELMDQYFYKRFGRNAKVAIRQLYMYSRKWTLDSSLEAPDAWKKEFGTALLEESLRFAGNPYVDWFGAGKHSDVTLRFLKDKMVDLVRMHVESFTPAWVSCAILRGWEVHGSMDTLEPVYDDKQKEMAEALVRFLFSSKLRVLGAGIEDYAIQRGGVRRY